MYHSHALLPSDYEHYVVVEDHTMYLYNAYSLWSAGRGLGTWRKTARDAGTTRGTRRKKTTPFNTHKILHFWTYLTRDLFNGSSDRHTKCYCLPPRGTRRKSRRSFVSLWAKRKGQGQGKLHGATSFEQDSGRDPGSKFTGRRAEGRKKRNGRGNQEQDL